MSSPIIYCWRYENQPFCKIGKSFLEIVWNSRLKYAQSVNVLDIEILGICRCDSVPERDKLEKHLLNERFNKIRSDRRELVHFNRKVWHWLQQDSTETNWTIEKLKELPNPYASANNERETRRYHENKEIKILKTRAQKIYRKWSVEPESLLSVGGPTLARDMVVEDLEAHGVDESTIQEWLDELENID